MRIPSMWSGVFCFVLFTVCLLVLTAAHEEQRWKVLNVQRSVQKCRENQPPEELRVIISDVF